MSQTFDLDAAVAKQAGEPFVFTWGDQPFSVPPILDRDIEDQLKLIDTIDRMDDIAKDPKGLLEIVRLAVGEDLLAQMRKARPIGAKALMTLVTAWVDHEGAALGKSEASPASSTSTAPKPKPTSRSGRARGTS